MDTDTSAQAGIERRSPTKSWMLALALGAALALGGAATVFAASPSAEPSAGAAADDGGGTTDDGTTDGDRLCDREHDGAPGTDDASS